MCLAFSLVAATPDARSAEPKRVLVILSYRQGGTVAGSDRQKSKERHYSCWVSVKSRQTPLRRKWGRLGRGTKPNTKVYDLNPTYGRFHW
jgi:hypothetical protein